MQEVKFEIPTRRAGIGFRLGRNAAWRVLVFAAVLSGCSSDNDAEPFTAAGTTGATTGGTTASASAAGSGTTAGSTSAAGASAATGTSTTSPGSSASAGATASAAGATASAAGASAANSGGASTFAAVVAILADSTHNCAICHSSAGSAANGGLQFNPADKAATYAALVGTTSVGAPNSMCGGKSYVVAGKPDESLLYEKVSSAAPGCGSKMPPAYMPLTEAELTTVSGWITAGANND